MNFSAMKHLLFLLFFCTNTILFAQLPVFQSKSASHIQHDLFKLQTVGNVLYLAAHPDDENTRLIAYYANQVGARTAYLSLTRGDGGQNLIGKEQRELMGLIRTHELLAARFTDGGEQIFSRANDFGYSKTADETMRIWDKEQVLADVVWTIRQFKPDLIITRFAPDYADTHGHHIASAQLAVEAFAAAADPKRFPEQLKYVSTHRSKRIFWNTSAFFFRDKPNLDKSAYPTIDVGVFNPLLGQHYGEIAAKSRSQHKSQGFGAAANRGEQLEYFKFLAGDSLKSNQIDEGIDWTWQRVPNSQKVAQLLQKAYLNFKPTEPLASVPLLLEALTAMRQLPQDVLVAYKVKQLEEIILHCAGIWAEAVSPDYSLCNGDSLTVLAPALMRYESKASLRGIQLKIQTKTGLESHDFSVQKFVLNKIAAANLKILLPTNLDNSHPYWLKEKSTPGMFEVQDQLQRGLPQNKPIFQVIYSFDVQGVSIELVLPLLHKMTDPVDGEVYRQVSLAPAATLNFEQEAYTWPQNTERALKVTVKAHKKNAKGTFQLKFPQGWTASLTDLDFDIKEKFGEQIFTVRVKPPQKSSEGTIKAELKLADHQGFEAAKSFTRIEYKHIPIQNLYPETETKINFEPIEVKAKRIGYIKGAGDALPQAIEQLGCEVVMLEENQIKPEILAGFQAVVLGVRAFNTIDFLKFKAQILFDYVQNGGVMLVQYNTNFELVTQQIAPFSLKISRERVTEENAKVRFLEPKHKLLSSPNKITEADFEGWVQERGLYFPNEWAAEFTPILAMQDNNEPERKGALLVAKHGKGHFIYTGLSLFRQLPANVEGAYRLLANLISLGDE